MKDNVEIGPTYEHLRRQVVDLLGSYTDMRDSHLETVRTVKHRIDFETPEAKTVHSERYRCDNWKRFPFEHKTGLLA